MSSTSSVPLSFFFNDTATTEIYTLSLHDALPISGSISRRPRCLPARHGPDPGRSEEHTSELQSLRHLVCRLLLEKKTTAERVAPPPSLAPPPSRTDRSSHTR